MGKTKENKDIPLIFYSVIYYVMIMCFSLTAAKSVYVNLSTIQRMLVIIIVSSVVLFFIKKPISIFFMGIAFMISVIICNNYFRDWMNEKFEFFYGFLENLIKFFKGDEQIFMEYGLLLWIIIIFAISLFTAIIIFKKLRVYLLLPIYILSFGYYWYMYIDVAYIWMAVFIMTYIVLQSSEVFFTKKKKWEEEKIRVNYLYKSWIGMGIVYSIIIAIFAIILPYKGPIIQINKAYTKIVEVFPQVKEFRQDITYSRSFSNAGYFNFSKTGFQNNSEKLGGPVKLDDLEVMKIDSKYPLYLRGNVKTIYTKDNWYKNKTINKNISIYNKMPQEVLDGELIDIKIENVNMASNTIFSPYQPIQISSERYDNYLYNKNFQLAFEDAVYKNEKYKIKAYISKPTDRRRLLPAKESLGKEYTQIPENVSKKVYDLTKRVIGNEVLDYQKAMKIQDFLRKNYEYELNVSYVPDEKSFIEFFLFEEKEGYCTYFATAMAVMLRVENIPSRYIEGYKMPKEKENGQFSIKQKHAHAWVEAYIEPYGWLKFEPTPIYDRPNELEKIKFSNFNQNILEDEPSMFLGKSKQFLDKYNKNGIEDYSDTNISKKKIFKKIEMKDIIGLIFLIIFVLIIPIRAIFILYKIKQNKIKLNEISFSKQYIVLYRNTLEILKLMGYEIRGGETLYEFAERIIPKTYDERFDFRKMTEKYIETEYGEVKRGLDDRDEITEYFNFLDKRVKNYLGFRKYYYIKFLKGNMYRFYKK